MTLKTNRIMENKITIKEGMADFYKNAGKILHLYRGLYSENQLKIKGQELTVLCENDVQYVTVDKDNDMVEVAKSETYSWIAPYTINYADVIFPEITPLSGKNNTIECRICLYEKDDDKAREMIRESIRKAIEKINFSCNGL